MDESEALEQLAQGVLEQAKSMRCSTAGAGGRATGSGTGGSVLSWFAREGRGQEDVPLLHTPWFLVAAIMCMLVTLYGLVCTSKPKAKLN